jgi:type IV secretory pathway VirB4 component
MLDSKLVYLKPALFQQQQGFMSILPIATDKLEVHRKLNSSPLSSIFPFVSFDLTSDNGILYGINRHNSSLVLFDRYSLENYNSVIFAKSGSGKSYATKLEILRSLMFGTEVIVIDPEREYEYMANATDGRHFNISLSSEHHINPFDLPIPREDEAPSDVLRTNIINLVGLFRLMLGGLTPEEDSIVDKAITETYAIKDITADSDFKNIDPPLLSDFEMVLGGMEGGDVLLQKLTKYTQGSWAGFINRPTNVDINKKFVVFSVRDMEEDLKSVAMYIITHFIWNAVRKDLRKRLIIVDEAWYMMKSEDTASFLYGIAKRGRKYYVGLCTITQDVEDFLRSPYGLPMLTNSSIQFLMKQSPTSVEVVQKTFNLTDEEKYLLLESNVGEGIFFAGLKHVALKVIASYTEDQIITSDPSQILAIKKAKQELAAQNEEKEE